MAFDEVVDERQRGGHPAGASGVTGCHLQRVDPHGLVRDALQPLHLLGQHLGVAAVPAVAEDHDDRPRGPCRGRPTGR